MSDSTETKRSGPAPIRVTIADAAKMLNVSNQTMRDLVVRRKIFTERRDVTYAKRGGKIYVLVDEITIYAERGADALYSFRKKLHRR